ncbi:MAG: Cobalt-precorrin-2 C(20)-methyltransferase [Nitrospira sp.]|jgi:precorrin-2/cobalt-factor-2 C20-methyltransferase|nr:MAG: Cobalt-precorrin-2 C(20)-methyltransferase [Nitrospira sp.]
MTYGALYGVGVGPGAPDLITLRALNVMRRAQVLALPRSSDYGASKAWEIVKPVLGEAPGQERLFLTFPMNKDPQLLRPAWDKAFAAIGQRLERGMDVAFATEGDPSLFSTFIYLKQEAPIRWPGISIEVVPGVSSIMAVPAVTGVPLADGQERIAIVPGTYGIEDLEELLLKFDTVVLMKLGGEMPHIIEVLDQTGLLDRAVYVSKATMGEQRIVRDLRKVRVERGDCFAMVIVSRKERSGVLAGTVPFRDGLS